MVLGDDTVRVIWAYHHKKPTNKHHIHHHGHKERGVRSLHLKESPKPKILKDVISGACTTVSALVSRTGINQKKLVNDRFKLS